jgi:hypothetical protein
MLINDCVSHHCHDREAKQDAREGLYVTAHSHSARADRSLLPIAVARTQSVKSLTYE